MAVSSQWSGVFPAVGTQFHEDYSLDLPATHKVISNLVADGVDGLVVCGTVGENTTLSSDEKIQILEAALDAAGKRVPVVYGIAELATPAAAQMAKRAQATGADGIMVMPPLSYTCKPHETARHFREVARASDTPMMVYNNPPVYKNDVTPDILASLTDCDTIRYFKDSSGDTRRFTDLRNMVGDRFTLFAGLDDVIVESVFMGAVGWVSGMSNVFPREGSTLFKLAAAGKVEELRPLYDWFMPLLHLDARSDLVQCIKYCESVMGRGSALTRPPRMGLLDAEKAEIDAMMARALESRPELKR